jgi:hypothetical protein
VGLLRREDGAHEVARETERVRLGRVEAREGRRARERRESVERPGSLRVEGDAQDPRRAVLGVDARGVAELLDQRRKAPERAQAEAQERTGAARLAEGREHPRGGARRLAGELAALEERDGEALLRQRPADGAADHAAADDEDVRRHPAPATAARSFARSSA